MKLQKLTYYSQAWNLVWEERELFHEDFEAWANGPVSPELYVRHRGEFLVNSQMFADIPDDLTKTEEENIDKVLAHYGDKTAQWLSDLTHMEDPWNIARTQAGVSDGERCNTIINKGEMHLYYSGL
jgi:uncharacterized phage-associated protein